MAKTEEGKKLERLFKNQETPEESLVKMKEGFNKQTFDTPKKEDFVAKPFKEIYDNVIKYILSKGYVSGNNEIKLVLVRGFWAWLLASSKGKHCGQCNITIEIKYRENNREPWYTYDYKLCVCPCCGETSTE